MSWPQIGSESFISMEGLPDEVGEELEEITRPNTDGHAYRELGKRSDPVWLQTVKDVADEATAHTRAATYKGYAGTLKTITWPTGRETPNCAILKVKIDRIKVGALGEGGTGNGSTLLTASWFVQVSG